MKNCMLKKRSRWSPAMPPTKLIPSQNVPHHIHGAHHRRRSRSHLSRADQSQQASSLAHNHLRVAHTAPATWAPHQCAHKGAGSLQSRSWGDTYFAGRFPSLGIYSSFQSVGRALKMEDPATEVEGVVRALVDKPTLQRQAETLKRYATNDVEFYHLYANLNTGLRALIATYQAAQLFLNYSGVDFHNIVYDASRNDIAVRATVYIRPWLLLWRTVPLQLFILLELEDVIVNGKTVKKIRVQRDYFIRAPSVQFLPIVGEIYNSETLRFVWGNTLALLVQFFQWLVTCLFPAKYWQAWLGLDSSDVAFRAD